MDTAKSPPELNKGLGELPMTNWSILEEEVSLPAAVVIQPLVQHNVHWMFEFASKNRMALCPHVKTTMCPKVVDMQVSKGVWGLTTATPHQTAVMHSFGHKRILMANQLVGKRNMEIISEILENDPEFEFYCLVDSVRNVLALSKFFGDKYQKLRILVEIGIEGGRTGIRTQETLAQTLKALKAAEATLLTCGVEFFEGVVNTEAEVKAFCKKAFDALLFLSLTFRDTLESPRELIISGAGSAWFDIVAHEISAFRRANFHGGPTAFDHRKLVPVLRPGCYVVHDKGLYLEAAARVSLTNSPPSTDRQGLKPALKVVAYVQSRPESTLAIVGMGRRDVATDHAFPIPFQYTRTSKPKMPLGIRTADSDTSENRYWDTCPAHWKVTKIMDQHAFLAVSENDELLEGDIIAFDISHPCNTFSGWRHVLLVDESYNVLDVAPTYF